MNVRAIVNQHKQKSEVVQQIKRTKQVRMIGYSMLPILDPSEVCVLFITECSEYEVGSVVVFEHENSFTGFTVHRIIRIEGNKVLTKGDNNLQSDDRIDKAAILGKIENVLYINGSFHNVKTSRKIARLSWIESGCVKVMPKKAVCLMHCLLVKIYKWIK